MSAHSSTESTASGSLRFTVRNLDSGETFHIDNAHEYCSFDTLNTFPSPRQRVRVSIPSTRVTEDERGCFTAYHLQVQLLSLDVSPPETKGATDLAGSTSPDAGSSSRRVRRRYNDFATLHEQLRSAALASAIDSPLHQAWQRARLPPKKWFGNLSGDVVSFRQRALEAYLQILAALIDPYDFVPLGRFLALLPSDAPDTVPSAAAAPTHMHMQAAVAAAAAADEAGTAVAESPEPEQIIAALHEELKEVTADAEAQLAQLTGQMRELQAESAELLKDLSLAETQRDDLAMELEETKQELAQLREVRAREQQQRQVHHGDPLGAAQEVS